MKLWLRINGIEFSSWSIVYKELALAFRNIGITVHDDIGYYPPDIKEYIEMWWCDPEFWEWSDKKVRLRVGVALSEHHSLFASNPKKVINNINKCDILFCPSRFAMRAFLESPINVPIYLMPFGVNPEEFYYVKRDFSSLRFLHLGVTQFRKGSWLACEGFIKAFNKNDNVSLTIASHRSSNMYEVLRNEYRNNSQIIFSDKKIPSSMGHYKNHDILVSPHLSEGFGLCIPEAMATGMPAIVSRCSAPLEFFSDKYGWWIEMSELYSPVNQCFPGINGLWRLPDVNSLAERMRYAYENREECVAKSKEASQYVLSNLTWTNSVNTAVGIMEKYL